MMTSTTHAVVLVAMMLSLTLAQSPIDMKLTKSSCQTRTQVDSSVLERVRAGDYNIDDKNLYAHAFCVYRSIGIIDDSANINDAAVLALANQVIDKDRLQSAVDVCSKSTGADANEKAFKIVKCFHDLFPEEECDL